MSTIIVKACDQIMLNWYIFLKYVLFFIKKSGYFHCRSFWKGASRSADCCYKPKLGKCKRNSFRTVPFSSLNLVHQFVVQLENHKKSLYRILNIDVHFLIPMTWHTEGIVNEPARQCLWAVSKKTASLGWCYAIRDKRLLV